MGYRCAVSRVPVCGTAFWELGDQHWASHLYVSPPCSSHRVRAQRRRAKCSHGHVSNYTKVPCFVPLDSARWPDSRSDSNSELFTTVQDCDCPSQGGEAWGQGTGCGASDTACSADSYFPSDLRGTDTLFSQLISIILRLSQKLSWEIAPLRPNIRETTAYPYFSSRSISLQRSFFNDISLFLFCFII